MMKRFRSNFLCSMFAFSAFLGSLGCVSQAFADDPGEGQMAPCYNNGLVGCSHVWPFCTALNPAKPNCGVTTAYCNCY
jgi:hypothetical protein